MTTINPFVHPHVRDFISYSTQLLLSLEEPTHIVFPEVAIDNYQRINNKYQEYIDTYFALKSTASMAIIRAVAKTGAGADVSTLEELNTAIECGYKNIICSGPKNKKYLQKCISEQKLISVDSIFELKTIIASKNKANILLRVSDPGEQFQDTLLRPSKFGIPHNELKQAIALLNKSAVNVKGMHFHADGYSVYNIISFIASCLSDIELLRKKGHSADIINIGGGFRDSVLDEPTQWITYIKKIEQQMTSKKDVEIWGKYRYGLQFSKQGTIMNRQSAENIGVKNRTINHINQILGAKVEQTPIKTLLSDANIRLVIEPGYAISTTAGITIFSVIGSKKTSCNADLLVVDGHMFHVSANMLDHITDPLLVTKNKSKDNFKGYIVGTLCREDDFLMKRKVEFTSIPKEKDKLVFVNTGSYAMSYESANPQRTTPPRRYYAIKKNTWELHNDC